MSWKYLLCAHKTDKKMRKKTKSEKFHLIDRRMGEANPVDFFATSTVTFGVFILPSENICDGRSSTLCGHEN